MEEHKDHLRKGENVSFVSSLLAGSSSGLVARTVTAPLDTLKLRLQTLHIKQSQYNGKLIWNFVRDMWKQEGPASFWKGNVPGSIMYVLYGGVQFGSYTYYSSLLQKYGWTPQCHSLVVGALTGMTSSVVSYPFDMLRTRLAVQRDSSMLRMRQEIARIWHRQGIHGFFYGCLASIVTITLSVSIMFGTYESIRIYSEETGHMSALLSASAGSISGVTSKVTTFPLDTIRRRMQVATGEYKSSLRIGLNIMRDEGVMALFRGLTMGLCKTVPNTAINLWMFELFISAIS